MKLLLALAIVFMPAFQASYVPVSPVLSATADGEAFIITFEAGADRTCTIFTQLDTREETVACADLFPNQSVIEHNWFDIPKLEKEWSVYAAVGYPKGEDYYIAESRRIRVRR